MVFVLVLAKYIGLVIYDICLEKKILLFIFFFVLCFPLFIAGLFFAAMFRGIYP